MLLGVTEQPAFVDAPGHSADIAPCRARGCAIRGNRSAIAIDRPPSAVEVHPLSANSVNMADVTIEYGPPAAIAAGLTRWDPSLRTARHR